MTFHGKLDVRLLSANLSELVSQEAVKTKVRIGIDEITLGSSVLETGPQPEWREAFSAEVMSVSELRAEVYSQPDREGETLLGQGLAGLADIRSQGSDEETIQYTLELRPLGQIFLEIKFHPPQGTEPRKEKIKQEGNYLHRGHRYIHSSSLDLIKCAFCQVSAGVSFF